MKPSSPGDLPIVIAARTEHSEEARAIATRFALRFGLPGHPHSRFVLLFNEGRLELHDTDGSLGTALNVDFTSISHIRRGQRAGRSNEPLARAMGLKKSPGPTVLDATAGVGRDAFVLAVMGCSVTMCERSPAIAALLDNALTRARRDSGFRARIGSRLRLEAADAIDVLASLDEEDCPQVVYIDPMYPQRPRSAQVKREMQYLRALVGRDLDSATLLNAALRSAKCRVVVKRRRIDPQLTELAPNHSIFSEKTRFDVYLRAN